MEIGVCDLPLAKDARKIPAVTAGIFLIIRVETKTLPVLLEALDQNGWRWGDNSLIPSYNPEWDTQFGFIWMKTVGVIYESCKADVHESVRSLVRTFVASTVSGSRFCSCPNPNAGRRPCAERG